MDTRAYVSERQPLVDRALDAWLPSADEPPEALHAIGTSVFGKCVRCSGATAQNAASHYSTTDSHSESWTFVLSYVS